MDVSTAFFMITAPPMKIATCPVSFGRYTRGRSPQFDFVRAGIQETNEVCPALFSNIVCGFTGVNFIDRISLTLTTHK
jgi:hypothetical protein